MKKLILLLTIGVISFPSLAQTSTLTDDDFKHLQFGVYMAPTYSFMRPSAAKNGTINQENAGGKIGFTYGLLGDYNFTDNYAIASGLQVNITGGQINTLNSAPIDKDAIKTHFDYTLQYLEIPLALKLKTDPIGGAFRIFGQAGLSIGFNISKKATYEILQKRTIGDTTFKVDEKEKITGSIGAIAPIIFQMNVGGGIQYKIGNKLEAYAGIFFNNGFAPNITDPTKYSNTSVPFTDGNTRLNNFALRLGFFF